MFNTKEIILIIVTSLILAFTLSVTTLSTDLTVFLYLLLSIFIIIIINSIAKKFAAHFYESEMEIKLWEISRYGFKPHKKFKKNFPAGLALPIIITALSFGYLFWLSSLVFDVKAKTYRTAKRHGLYLFSEMTEDHIGYIAATGIFVNLFAAILGYFLDLPSAMNFVSLNIFYAFFNMLPISDLDGNKIFFGNIVLWAFMATLTLIGIIATIKII